MKFVDARPVADPDVAPRKDTRVDQRFVVRCYLRKFKLSKTRSVLYL
jgi:hypothetical protein